MAIINLTVDNVEGIIGQVHEIFNHERLALLEKTIEVPDVGDEVYSWLISRENNKKIIEAMPPWCQQRHKQIYIKVNTNCIIGSANENYIPILRLDLKEDWCKLASSWMPIDIPFAVNSTWDSNVLYLWLENTDKVPQGPAGDFVKKLFAIAKEHAELDNKVTLAVVTMREFLSQHRTLQTALKECPAVMSYVPEWMKQELNRVPPKRVRRPPMPKTEKKEIDMSQLVTQATISKLNL